MTAAAAAKTISAIDAAASPPEGSVMVPAVTGGRCAERAVGGGWAGAGVTGLTSAPIGLTLPSWANPQSSSFDA